VVLLTGRQAEKLGASRPCLSRGCVLVLQGTRGAPAGKACGAPAARVHPLEVSRRWLVVVAAAAAAATTLRSTCASRSCNCWRSRWMRARNSRIAAELDGAPPLVPESSLPSLLCEATDCPSPCGGEPARKKAPSDQHVACCGAATGTLSSALLRPCGEALAPACAPGRPCTQAPKHTRTGPMALHACSEARGGRRRRSPGAGLREDSYRWHRLARTWWRSRRALAGRCVRKRLAEVSAERTKSRKEKRRKKTSQLVAEKRSSHTASPSAMATDHSVPRLPSPSLGVYEESTRRESAQRRSSADPLNSSRSMPSQLASRQPSLNSMFSEESRALLLAKHTRKRADEDVVAMQNRINRLKMEEYRAHKNIQETHLKADDIVRLKAQNELKARAKEKAKKMHEEQLRRERQQKTLDRAIRDANIRSNRQHAIRLKQQIVQDHRKEKMKYAQITADFRRAEEERAAKVKQDIYIRERKAVHDKYKDKHLAQLRALQQYEERVRDEEEKRLQRERELERLEREEEALLQRLKAAQELQKSAYAELEVALEV